MTEPTGQLCWRHDLIRRLAVHTGPAGASGPGTRCCRLVLRVRHRGAGLPHGVAERLFGSRVAARRVVDPPLGGRCRDRAVKLRRRQRLIRPTLLAVVSGHGRLRWLPAVTGGLPHLSRDKLTHWHLDGGKTAQVAQHGRQLRAIADAFEGGGADRGRSSRWPWRRPPVPEPATHPMRRCEQRDGGTRCQHRQNLGPGARTGRDTCPGEFTRPAAAPAASRAATAVPAVRIGPGSNRLATAAPSAAAAATVIATWRGSRPAGTSPRRRQSGPCSCLISASSALPRWARTLIQESSGRTGWVHRRSPTTSR